MERGKATHNAPDLVDGVIFLDSRRGPHSAPHGALRQTRAEEKKLTLEGSCFTLGDVSIDLEEPFSTRLLRPHGAGDFFRLVLEIQPTSGGSVGRPTPIRLALPPTRKSAVTDAIPSLDVNAVEIDSDAFFERVWPRILSHADLHGQSIHHVLTAAQSSRVEAVAQEVEARQG
jgi:hypothetical protein